MYKRVYIGKRTEFLGQASHIKAIQEVKAADWSIIIREDNKVVKAGFPTKVVESISCGTPVIANDFSNILDYLNDKNSIICKVDDLQSAIIKASKGRKCICENPFNYRNFLQTIEEFFRANRQKIL
jgi:glycosyltransferase involved in cell wall biosynthesis